MSQTGATAKRPHRFVQKLSEANAVDDEHAISLEEIGWHDMSAVRHLVAAGLVGLTMEERYYLEKAEEEPPSRRKLGLTVIYSALILSLIATAVLWLST